MDISFSIEVFNFLIMQSYLFIFFLMWFQGPIVTALAAFAASLGYFDVKIILVLSFLGNFIPDLILFSIGRIGRKRFVENFVKKFGIDKKHILKLERDIHNHFKKTLVLIKLTPLLPVPGIILSGFMKTSFKKFLVIDIIFNILSALIFTGLGFYFGLAAKNVLIYFKYGGYILLFLVLFGISLYFFYRRLTSLLVKIISNLKIS